jgi:RNA polymerase sigma-70 factor, ECF subfamily
MPVAEIDVDEVQEAFKNREDAPTQGSEHAREPLLDDLAHIYARYNARVYYLCLRMTGNAHDAEDLSQEAFLRLIQKHDTFRGESAFYAWLRRLTINVVLLRFQKASWQHEVSLDELLDPVFDKHSKHLLAAIDPEMVGTIDRINLERAMDLLPPGFRTVFVLHDIEGYQHAEISKLLGCSIGTSKSQLHKARLKMRELLDETRGGNAPRTSPERKLDTHADRIPVPPTPGQILQFPRPARRDGYMPLSRTA